MTEPQSREGTMFGHYRLLRLIGKGGMGEVYEAEDTVKDRVVALKLLPEGVSHDSVFRNAFSAKRIRLVACRNPTWCRFTTTARSTACCTSTCG